MKLLNLDMKDTKDMTELSSNEARKWVEEGKNIICQDDRDFYELSNANELTNMQHLETCGVYSTLKYYIR
jgi:hypothetical protein